MNNLEAKEALNKEFPVIYDDIEYLKITALIYRKRQLGLYTTYAEMLDKNKNGVVTAPIVEVHRKEADDAEVKEAEENKNYKIIDEIEKVDNILIDSKEMLYKNQLERAYEIVFEAIKALLDIGEKIENKKEKKD